MHLQVIDGIGKSTVDISIDSLARRGIFVSFGNASGAVPPFPVLRLIKKSAFVTRPKLLDYVADREELLMRSSEVSTTTRTARSSVGLSVEFSSRLMTLQPRCLPLSSHCVGSHRDVLAACALCRCSAGSRVGISLCRLTRRSRSSKPLRGTSIWRRGRARASCSTRFDLLNHPVYPAAALGAACLDYPYVSTMMIKSSCLRRS